MNEEEISGSSSNSPAFGAISNLDNLIRKYDQFRGQDKSFRAINNIIQRILQDDSISSTHQEKWDTILDVILKYVLSAPNIYLKLTVDIFSHFLTDNAFQLSLSNRLRVKTVESLFISLTDEEDYESEHFGEPDNMSKVRNFCKLIARLLINNWSSENQLFAHNALTSLSISAVHTWLDVINKYNGNRMSEIEDNGCHLETCCFCLIQIVNHSGRKLWLNWPDLVDRMKMRERLLASYVLINEWCKSVKSSSDSYRFNGFDGHILSNSTNSFKPLRESNSSPSEKYTFRTRYSRYFNNSGKNRFKESGAVTNVSKATEYG